MRTNPRSGPTASQVPRRGTTRSRNREEAVQTAVSDPAASASGVDQQATKNRGEGRPVRDRQDISRDEIARLAYSYWEARGGNGGSPEDDWFRAEQELLALSRAVGRG